ncbi:PspC domain-containing protein [Myroides sp. LJL116]
MNKTLTINIAGSVFHIEENAYIKLDDYLKAIKSTFPLEERDEIIHDIEIRVAELFFDFLTPSNQVITLKEVEKVIQIMGNPGDYSLEDEPKEQSQDYTYTAPRRLYRDTQNKVFGGVLSGLGHYFQIDPVWLRIIFVVLVLFFGTGVLLYFILWIIIPPARTTAQILQMEGQPINIDTIQNSVKKNMDEFQKKMDSLDMDPIKERVRGVGESSGKWLSKFFGIVFIIISTLMFIPILLVLSLALLQDDFIPSQILSQKLGLMPESMHQLTLGVFFFFALPIIGLFILGLRLIYSNLKYVGWTILLLFLLWIGSIFYFSLPLAANITNFTINSKSYRINNMQVGYGYRITTNQEQKSNFYTQELPNTDHVIIGFKSPSFLEDSTSIEQNPLQSFTISISPTMQDQIYIKAIVKQKRDAFKSSLWQKDWKVIKQNGDTLFLAASAFKDILPTVDREDIILDYTLYLPQDKTVQMTQELSNALGLPDAKIGKRYTLNKDNELIAIN